VRATVLLADAAQADLATGKVHILGAGWSVTNSPLPPHAIISLIGVSAADADSEHQMKLVLVDSDDKPVRSSTATVEDQRPHLVGMFRADRPADLVGPEMTLPIVVQVPGGIDLPGGTYTWRLEIDGKTNEHWSVSFSVR
jgi:hypothetical protein